MRAASFFLRAASFARSASDPDKEAFLKKRFREKISFMDSALHAGRSLGPKQHVPVVLHGMELSASLQLRTSHPKREEGLKEHEI